MNGKFVTKQPLGEDMDMILQFYNLQGGQYKLMLTHRMDNFCKSIYKEEYKATFEDYQAHTTNPVRYNQCPYPASENEVKNFIARDVTVLPPRIPGGEKWRLDTRFYKKGKSLGGHNFYVIFRSQQSFLCN